MSLEYVNVNGKKWVVGLWWQCVASQKTAAKEAIALADEFEAVAGTQFNCFTVIPGDIPQIGLAYDEAMVSGKVTKAPSLAAALVSKFETDDFLLRIRIMDGVWIFASTDGVIDAEGDFFGTVDESNKHFNTLQKSATWTRVIDKLEMDATAAEEYLVELLGTDTKPINLRSLEQTSTTALWLLAGFVVTAIIVGLLSFSYIQKKAKNSASLAPLKLTANKNAVKVQAVVVHPQLFISLAETLKLCTEAFELENITYHGWEMSGWACSGSGERLRNWESTDSTDYSSIPPSAKLNITAPGKLVATMPAVAIPEKVVLANENALLTRHELLLVMRKFAKDLNSTVALAPSSSTTLNKVAAEAQPLPSSEKAPKLRLPVGAAYVYSWTVESQVIPFQSIKKIVDAPGIGISRITWDVKTGNWKTTGEAYANTL